MPLSQLDDDADDARGVPQQQSLGRCSGQSVRSSRSAQSTSPTGMIGSVADGAGCGDGGGSRKGSGAAIASAHAPASASTPLASFWCHSRKTPHVLMTDRTGAAKSDHRSLLRRARQHASLTPFHERHRSRPTKVWARERCRNSRVPGPGGMFHEEDVRSLDPLPDSLNS